MSLKQREPQPYALADKAISYLSKKAKQRLAQTKRYLIADFDEANVMYQIEMLYTLLDRDNRERFISLYEARYKELVDTEDDIHDFVVLEVYKILGEPDPVTNYAYDTETIRKRERAKESVKSVPGRLQKQLLLDKAIRLWNQETAQYADIVSDAATIQAFKDAGVEKVKWVTQNDEKVCSKCNALDGKVFPITQVPTKPHWRCRCTITSFSAGAE